ncbi:MAG: phosphatidate cytidylyltransferase [Bacteroidota bacterium]
MNLLKNSLFFFLIPFITGCSAIEGIFEAGVWVGVLLVLVLIALLILLIRKILK